MNFLIKTGCNASSYLPNLSTISLMLIFMAYFQVTILVESDPVCSMSPSAPTELLYKQIVQMSCSVSYTADTLYVVANMIWVKTSPNTILTSSTPQFKTSDTWTTAVSTITAPRRKFTPFPIYVCNTTFRITGNLSSGSANNDYSKSTSLSSSPINVICKYRALKMFAGYTQLLVLNVYLIFNLIFNKA